MRRILFWLGAGIVAIVATVALLWLTTATAARFEMDGDRLHVSGHLTLASTERLDRLIEQNGDLAVLVLGEVSAAGDVTALLQKGSLVRAAGLSTEVAPGVTVGGDGVYLFLAGIDRRLRDGASLALTDWQTTNGPASELPRDHPAHAERLDYVTRMLGAEDFYWFMLEKGATGPHSITPEEARALNVVTAE
jgi:hypothetical protein